MLTQTATDQTPVLVLTGGVTVGQLLTLPGSHFSALQEEKSASLPEWLMEWRMWECLVPSCGWHRSLPTFPRALPVRRRSCGGTWCRYLHSGRGATEQCPGSTPGHCWAGQVRWKRREGMRNNSKNKTFCSS